MIHLPWSMTTKRYICNIRNTIMSLLRQIKNKLLIKSEIMTTEIFLSIIQKNFFLIIINHDDY